MRRSVAALRANICCINSMGDVLLTLWCRTHFKVKEARRGSPGDSRAL